MRVAHILRKYNPAQWGGTETAVKQLCDGLRAWGVENVVYAPKLCEEPATDPIAESGTAVRRYKAAVPVWGISPEQRNRLISVGGNLLSIELIRQLWKDDNLQLIHTHALNRIGGSALTVARLRKIPLVVTIHGGAMDLPESARKALAEPLNGGWEWGRIFGWLLKSRRVLELADAVLALNKKEAGLLQEKYPNQRVLVVSHGVPLDQYQQDAREAAAKAFPRLAGRPVVACVARIDPVKNQRWLVEQWPEVLRRHPRAALVLLGSCTDAGYGEDLRKLIDNNGLQDSVFMPGGVPRGDPRLVGLLQSSAAVVVPSWSETFGLVILEAWAAGAAVLSSKSSGAVDLIEPGRNGLLFDLEDPAEFHRQLDRVLGDTDFRTGLGKEGQRDSRPYDSSVKAAKIKALYEHLIEAKKK